MATTTLLRNISGVDDVRAALSNSTLRRLLSIGTNWTKVRVGIRWSILNTAADITSAPFLAVGVCAGTANPVNNGSATTDHFLGVRTTTTTWQIKPGPYYVGDVTYSLRASKRVGTTWTNTSGTNNLWYAWYVIPGQRQMLFVYILKGSPNFTISVLSVSTISGTADVSQADFFDKVVLASPGNWNGHYLATGNTVAVDEATNGYLNAVNVAWHRSNPKVEISDLAVVRLA